MKKIFTLVLALCMPISVSAACLYPDYTPIIHNQENTASCWAHASVALAETLSYKAGVPSAFSTAHLIANTKTGGGSPALFWTYALTRLGLKNADLTPSAYRILSHTEKNGADLLWTKTQIERFGAVTAQVYYPETTEKTLYSPHAVIPNHQIILIGYDDAYPAENFTPVPSRNGAFLAQNSYGAEKNEQGLFWISYDDSTVLSQVEAATSLVYDPAAYTPQKEWQTHAIYAETWTETLAVSVSDGELLRSITLPHIAADTTVNLTVGAHLITWHQQEEGSYTAYFPPVEKDVTVTLMMRHPEGNIYRPLDEEGNVVLLCGFSPSDAPTPKPLLSAATPETVSFLGQNYLGYQILGQNYIRLRDWAAAQGRGVLWEDGTVILTDTPVAQTEAQPNENAVAVLSQSNIVGDIPTPLYFIDGYQYLIVR